MFRRQRKRTLFAVVFSAIVFYLLLLDRSRSSSWSLWKEIHRDDQLFISPRSSCATTNIRRAIVVHFPVQRASHYLPELKWLYLSWIETIRRQPVEWETDLLVYSLPSSDLDQLGCEWIEKRSGRKNQCFRIDYQSLWNRSDDILARSIQRHVPVWCQHLDSLAILLEQSAHLDRYDYVLRTDLDVFLTPRFARYIPFDCSFQVGRSDPSDEVFHRSNSRSRWIHAGLHLEETVSDCSNTATDQCQSERDRIDVVRSEERVVEWRLVLCSRYAPPRHAVLVARLALWLSVWLSENEFTRMEKDQRLSILSWPQWYIGVRLSLSLRLSISIFSRSCRCMRVI